LEWELEGVVEDAFAEGGGTGWSASAAIRVPPEGKKRTPATAAASRGAFLLLPERARLEPSEDGLSRSPLRRSSDDGDSPFLIPMG
jgi:hypothetical protein